MNSFGSVMERCMPPTEGTKRIVSAHKVDLNGNWTRKGASSRKTETSQPLSVLVYCARDTYWKIIRDVVRKWYFSIEKWFLTALSSVLCFLPVPESAVRP